MKDLIEYLVDGDNVASFLLAISMLAAGIILIEKLYTWVIGKLKKYYDFRHGKEVLKENETKQEERITELDTKLDTIINKINDLVSHLDDFEANQKRVNTILLRDKIGYIYKKALANNYILDKDKQDFKYAYDEYVRNGGNSYVIDEVEPFIHNLKVYMSEDQVPKELTGDSND